MHAPGKWGWGMKGIPFTKEYLNDTYIHSSEILQVFRN